MPINETFNGFIETTTDALLIFEACRRGILPKISRRLQDRERGAIRSGTIYVFDEKESGIRRWTDGLVWSPSRILANFLIYRELDGRESLHQKQHMETSVSYMANYYTPTSIYDPISEDLEDQLSSEERDRERNLVGSLTDTYKFKKGGLIKKTISIHLNGSIQHLISYYTKSDVLESKLSTPSSIPEISSLQIAPDLLLKQSFRVPPSVEFAELILKRPSLSPSSTVSSSTSSSNQTYYRKPYGTVKPGAPYSLHEGYRRRYPKQLPYDTYYSLPIDHSRRLSLESNVNKRQMRLLDDNSEESIRRRSSFMTHPVFDSSSNGHDTMHLQYNERNEDREAAHLSIRHHSFSGQNTSSLEAGNYQNMVVSAVASSSSSAFVPVITHDPQQVQAKCFSKPTSMDPNARCYLPTYRPQNDRMIPSFIEIPPQKEMTYHHRYSPSLPSPSSLIWSNSQHEVAKSFSTPEENATSSYFGYTSPSYLTKQLEGQLSPTEKTYADNARSLDKDSKHKLYTPYRNYSQPSQNNMPFTPHAMYSNPSSFK